MNRVYYEFTARIRASECAHQVKVMGMGLLETTKDDLSLAIGSRCGAP